MSPDTLKLIASVIILASAVLWSISVIVLWKALCSPHREFDFVSDFKHEPAFRAAFGYWFVFLCLSSFGFSSVVILALLLHVLSGVVTADVLKEKTDI